MLNISLDKLFVFMISFYVGGCTFVPTTSQIGDLRYQIRVVDGFHAWAEWDQAARVACPGGYKVIERQTTQGIPGYNVGTIECDKAK